MAENATLRAEDLVPVRSRLSWGAIIAGAVLALAVYLVLTLLGGAIGLTISDNVRTDSLKTGGAIWAILATAIALFVGGWVTTQCTVGENKAEAVVHGVIMWGVVLAMLLWLTATGVRAGFNAMVGMAYVGSNAARNTSTEDWEAAARRSGVPQATINDWRQKAADAPAETRRGVDPANQQAAVETATQATWWTLLGTLLSMAAAVAGAMVGAGPTFRLRGIEAPTTGGMYEDRRVHART
ncbi:MAG: hypothetical protein WD847_19395 [Pirellulales bacterium]